MRRNILFFLLTLFVSGAVMAQTIRPERFLRNLSEPDPRNGSRVTVALSAELDRRLNREVSLDNKMVEGYRIYLFRDNSQYGREKAREVLARFREAFPDITGDTLLYQSPDWKVVIGNCLTRDEAVIVFGRVKGLFEQAVIRQERIPLRNFLEAARQPAVSPEEDETEPEPLP
jgi:hypothetical protein